MLEEHCLFSITTGILQLIDQIEPLLQPSIFESETSNFCKLHRIPVYQGLDGWDIKCVVTIFIRKSSE